MTANVEKNAATSAPSKQTRSISLIIFDLFLLAFVGILVGLSLVGLSDSARLVPLIVGVPTLLGIVALLLLDLFPGLRRPGPKPPEESDKEGPGNPNLTPAPAEQATGEAGTSEEFVLEEAEEHPEARKREVTFTLWAVGFFALAAIFGLLISIPIALFVFFKLLNRESWVLTLAMTAGTWAFIYVLFGVVLGVRL